MLCGRSLELRLSAQDYFRPFFLRRPLTPQLAFRRAPAPRDRHWPRGNRARLVAAPMPDFSELFTLSGKI
jgi:hypothetical protein